MCCILPKAVPTAKRGEGNRERCHSFRDIFTSPIEEERVIIVGKP
jgi:hypothetical protein